MINNDASFKKKLQFTAAVKKHEAPGMSHRSPLALRKGVWVKPTSPCTSWCCATVAVSHRTAASNFLTCRAADAMSERCMHPSMKFKVPRGDGASDAFMCMATGLSTFVIAGQMDCYKSLPLLTTIRR